MQVLWFSCIRIHSSVLCFQVCKVPIITFITLIQNKCFNTRYDSQLLVTRFHSTKKPYKSTHLHDNQTMNTTRNHLSVETAQWWCLLGPRVAWLSVHSQGVWQSRGSSLASVTKLLEQSSKSGARHCACERVCVWGRWAEISSHRGRQARGFPDLLWLGVCRQTEGNRKEVTLVRNTSSAIILSIYV